jgi:hypothetical protein
LVARHLANAGVLAAFAALRDGDGQEAVRLLLDVLQLGRDLAQSALLIEQMIGCAVLSIAAGEPVKWANLLRHLDADALRAFAAGLGRLDAGLPLDSRWLASEAVLFANESFEPPPPPPGLPTSPVDDFSWVGWRAWRYGFSTRLALADHGFAQLRLAEHVQALCPRQDAVDLPALKGLFAEYTASPNPVTATMTPNLESATKSRLGSIATLRLLRMAVQHAAGETVAPLADPSGGLLQWSVDADGNAEFWSDVDRKHAVLRVPR